MVRGTGGKEAGVSVVTLAKRADFLALKAKGKRVFRPAFVAQWLRDDSGVVNVGYTASGKGIGNAVKRNRARRRLRAAVDVLLRLNPVAAGVAPGDGVRLALIAKTTVLEQDFAVLVNDMRTAMAEMGLLVDGARD